MNFYTLKYIIFTINMNNFYFLTNEIFFGIMVGKRWLEMGLTVKRNDNLEKMFDQLTTQTKTSIEEKEKKNKFLAKGTNKKDSKK